MYNKLLNLPFNILSIFFYIYHIIYRIVYYVIF